MGTIQQDIKPVDTQCDKLFGEPVLLRPMLTTAHGMREAVPDPDRVEVIAVGIYDQSRGAVEPTGGGLLHRQATVDTTLSIRVEPVEQCQLRKGDRVYFPERREWHEVTYISDDPGGRPDVHLVRVLDDEVAPTRSRR